MSRRALDLAPSRVDRELGRERARGELRKGEALLVLLRVDPAALVHQVLLHVSGERNRPAEPQGAKPQEVEEKRPQARSLHGGRRGGPRVPPVAGARGHRRDDLVLARAALSLAGRGRPVSAAVAASAAYSA